jgi:hypothetical protein
VLTYLLKMVCNLRDAGQSRDQQDFVDGVYQTILTGGRKLRQPACTWEQERILVCVKTMVDTAIPLSW